MKQNDFQVQYDCRAGLECALDLCGRNYIIQPGNTQQTRLRRYLLPESCRIAAIALDYL